MVGLATWWARRGACAALALALVAGASEAQNRRTVLTVTGLPLSVTQTNTAAFDTSNVPIGTVTFTVNLTTNTGGGGFSPRRTTVQIRCNACTGNFARIQWRRGDLATWNTLSNTYVTIDNPVLAFLGGPTVEYTNTLAFRYQLAYASDPPSGPTSYQLQFQLVVTAP